MGKGREFADVPFSYQDERSGRTILRLTDYLGHSSHLYFTDPCWLDGGRALVFTSDRENQSNLFRCNLAGGGIVQLTDLHGSGRPSGAYCAATGRHYFWWNSELHELDPSTLAERIVYRVPDGWLAGGHASATADGRYVCDVLREDVRAAEPRISYSYSSFRESFKARPLSRVVRVDLATGEAQVLHEERCYTTHVNPSPRLPSLLTYCHEGPWDEVDQRIWGLDVQTGRTWPIRRQEGDVSIGHEYWLADGERLGYHGRFRPHLGPRPHIYGTIRWDGTGAHEVQFPYDSMHFHSLDERLIVGDGTPNGSPKSGARPFIQLFRRDRDVYAGPKLLAVHRSTFNDQHAHPHPRFTPDGKAVLYSSDLTGYANLYVVEVGDFDSLPDVAELDPTT